MSDIDPTEARTHLERLLASEQLGKAETGRKLLTYLFERALREDAPKETEIALDVFGKDASFNGAEDSVVRVGVRTLRQKLMEYYAGAGGSDPLQFAIPKGGYRLTFTRHRPGGATTPGTAMAAPSNGPLSTGVGAYSTANSDSEASRTTPRSAATLASASSSRGSRPWMWTAGIALTLLALSVWTNIRSWSVSHTATVDATTQRVRESPVWADMVDSPRPLTIVLGDLFMFTQTDPKTGHTLTVRDAEINSSEQLRALLADNPSFAAERGQRYVSMIQKSAAIGMSTVLRIVDTPGRRLDVQVREDLQADDIRRNDIVYVGPIAGLGPLAGYYQLRSRYRFDSAGPRLIDLNTQKVFISEGTLGGQRMDYALVAKFPGPAGNHIMILTAGLSNAGLLQNVRTLTSPEGLASLAAKVRAKTGGALPDSFEALLTVTGFRQTDLTTEIIEVSELPAMRRQNAAASPATNTAQAASTGPAAQ
ncbi:MAG TPA: hypothetical protein VGM84_13065 [Steroidobacteraceae bacterium]|jgi:hypothetical protein